MEKLANNWEFAKALDVFKAKMIDPQQKRVDDAWAILEDDKYPWTSEEQKKTGEKKFDQYRAWLAYYIEVHKQGMELVKQHEQLTDLVALVYMRWYDKISDNGQQPAEMMNMQAQMLQEIFREIYNVLEPLNIGIKPPTALI